jgi:hypothetical protein
MQTSQLWHRLHLSFKQIILLFVCCFSLSHTFAQSGERMNNAEHESAPYYFGITFGTNFAQYKVTPSSYFVANDTIKNITPLWKPGFLIGIMGNLRISNFIDIRTIPTFMIREKGLTFTSYDNKSITNSFESVMFTMPLEAKFKSDRQENFRFYVCAGGKFDFDFNANAKSKRKDDIIKVKSFDYGYNLGLGFEFYYPNFIFSPEIKISNGLGDILQRNDDEPTNKAIGSLTTRMILISFHIQG